MRPLAQSCMAQANDFAACHPDPQRERRGTIQLCDRIADRAGSFAAPRVAALCCCLAMLWTARAEKLTLATYNIENYGPADRMTEAGYRKDYPKPEPQKRALRDAIRGLNADVIVLQEMGPQAYLDELQRDLRTDGVAYPHATLGVAVDADRHVAILSRRPLQQVTTHTNLEFAYLGGRERVKRGLLEATLLTEAGPITLFAVHLKSRLTERPDDPGSVIRRAAEATAIRDHVLRRFARPAESRFVILGDCNDGKASKTVGFLQKRGKTEIARLLPAADSRGELWTHAFRREESYSRVDQILVSPALMSVVRGGVAHIYDGDGVREASDHRPVFVVLMLGQAAQPQPK
ncbi:MAG: endonuclease/exonuclease/phosphatase family protein [Opitutaceae bacterium]|nr:endonuclease/exonuclease/phosphatase family protein [Opitutaceae bacterium]